MLTKAVGIEFRQVSKRYGANGPMVVKGVDLVVPQGTLTTILGPSGCGKTTTLRMMAGLESPSGGQIFIHGREVTQMGPSERQVSMVFQNYALFPHMTVLQNVAYGLEVSRVARPQIAERARHALGTVGLHDMDHRYPSELSGGQQQRVALARALVIEPAVLLFDEPLSNLDARLRRNMREEIRSLQQRLGLTVAYVTHDQSEALAVSDQIVVMDAGQIAQVGSPQDLYERPNSAFVAGFMGEALLFDGQCLADGSVCVGPLRFVPRHAVGVVGAVKAAIRPEAWRVVSRSQAVLGGPLVKQAYLGAFQELTVETELGPVFVVSPQVQQRWALGEELGLLLGEQGVTVVAA